MEPVSSAAELSVHRSRLRERILLALSSLGEAYLGQLARGTGLPASRVKWCLYGYPPRYRVELALIPLGLAEERQGPVGRHFVITTKGRRKARSIVARRARVAEAKAMRRR